MSAIKTNAISPISHVPVAVAVEIPDAPVIDLPDFDGEEDPPSDVGDMFVGLLPAAPRAAVPAANDDIAEEDVVEPPSDVGAPHETHRVEANRKLRRIIGPRLFRARELSGYSQTEAATALGYATPSQLNQWETGRRLAPIFEVIKAARLYGVGTDYLLGESHEPDRDPVAGARHAILRGVRGMLERIAQITVSEIDRQQRLVGPHASNVRVVLDAGEGLIEAVGAFVRHNHSAFANQRGGATMQRRAEEFEAALAEVRTAIRLHDVLDGDLRRALADLAIEDELVGDEEA